MIVTRQEVLNQTQEQHALGAFRRSHHLSLERELPPKDMVLPSSSTKENLIELISSELCTRFETNNFPKRFVVTSKNPVPDQVQHGVRTKRRDLTSHYDEADYIMPQQVHSILKEEGKKSFCSVSISQTIGHQKMDIWTHFQIEAS